MIYEDIVKKAVQAAKKLTRTPLKNTWPLSLTLREKARVLSMLNLIRVRLMFNHMNIMTVTAGSVAGQT